MNNNSRKNKNVNNDNKIQVKHGYISLQEASKILPYSQEYISLLARRGKIHAKKFGRNWYTTKDAGEEYLKKQGISIIIPKEFFPSYIGKITRPVLTPFYLSKEDISKIEVPGEMEEQKEKEVILKEEKIQIEKPEIEVAKKPEVKKIEEISKPPEKISPKSYRLKLITGLAIILCFIITSIFYTLSPKDEKIAFSSCLKEKTSKTIIGLKNFIIKTPEEKKLAEKIKPGEIFLFEREFSNLEENIVGDVKVRFGGFRKEFGLEKPQIEEKENGVVIVPKDLTDGEKFKKELETSFADKVNIETDESGKSGIIKPVFAAPPFNEQSYLYMMVPVEEKKTP